MIAAHREAPLDPLAPARDRAIVAPLRPGLSAPLGGLSGKLPHVQRNDSFAATIGLCALLFGPLLGTSSNDPGIVLIAFVFPVALGVDYDIFLMSRAC